MTLDTTTEPVLPAPEEPAGTGTPYERFDLTRSALPHASPETAPAVRAIVALVPWWSHKAGAYTWNSLGAALHGWLVEALKGVAAHPDLDTYLKSAAIRHRSVQVASLTPELYAELRQAGDALVAGLKDLNSAETKRLPGEVDAYAAATIVTGPLFSARQVREAGVEFTGEAGYREADVQRAVRTAYADAHTTWVREPQYATGPEGKARTAQIEPATVTYGALRLADPAGDRVKVVWHLLGGSDRLDGWRTDAQLVVDLAPVAGDPSRVELTARVRGVAVARDTDGVWRRAQAHRADGEIKVQARDVNGAFTVVVRKEARAEIDVKGSDPAEPVSLTYTLPRAALIDHALDWRYTVQSPDGTVHVLRASVGGRRVLVVPPPMDDYRPGTVRDPATGERKGSYPGRDTPLNHYLTGHATVTTAADGEGMTRVTADVHIGASGLSGLATFAVNVTSTLERYDEAADAWRSVASKSTVKPKSLLAGGVDADTLTARVPTRELNRYRFRWAGRDTYTGGSGVEGAYFPLWHQPN
ncbi:hypothetical protein ACN20G_20340 [Streptomyces sp. BI20]|uniref:hypothetical protein n=1 Tax=Streptomyces sp. BI20 TaxID=3403460 RepID=UPI003C771906